MGKGPYHDKENKRIINAFCSLGNLQQIHFAHRELFLNNVNLSYQCETTRVPLPKVTSDFLSLPPTSVLFTTFGIFVTCHVPPPPLFGLLSNFSCFNRPHLKPGLPGF